MCLTAAAPAQQAPPVEGMNFGHYNVRQTVDFGWRIAGVDGSRAAYNTFVDLHNGARLLEQTLEVRSLNHAGLLFDTLSFSGFGYGGDPNTALRLRMDKNRWYALSSSVRRSRNVWDYDLFANPLNPPTSNPSRPVNSSPHSFDVVRRMSSTQLRLAPQSRVSVRLGYDRNVMEGPASTTFHPTDLPSAEFLLFLPWLTKQETLRAGVDVKLLPRTRISYDQFFERLRDGRSASDRTFAFQLANGTPYDLGLAFNTVLFQPCRVPVQNAATQPPTANPTCPGTSSFARSEVYHATYPTEQLGFQSSFFRDLDLSGRVSYSTAQMRMPGFVDRFTGLLPSTLQQQFADTASARARRTAVTGDLSATWAATDALQVTNVVRYARFRIPGLAEFSETSLFAASALLTPNTAATCRPPLSAANCPIHSGNSPADVIDSVSGSLLAQTSVSDQVEARYDVSGRVGARLGYRFERRDIDQAVTAIADQLFYPILPNRGDCAGVPLQPDGTCRVTRTTTPVTGNFLVHRHTAIAGAWAAPWPALRLNFDAEISNADDTYTRIEARRADQLRGRVSFRPRPWVELSAFANRSDGSNGAVNVEAGQHYRGYGFAAVVSHRKSLALQLNYDYARDSSHAVICYVAAQSPAGAAECPGLKGYLRATSFYDHALRFGSLALRWTPASRVSASAGYSISRGGGSALLLNPLAVPGAIDSTWQRPTASLAIGLTKRLTWRGVWGYYGYDEPGAAGPTLTRDFSANVGTVSLRYAF